MAKAKPRKSRGPRKAPRLNGPTQWHRAPWLHGLGKGSSSWYCLKVKPYLIQLGSTIVIYESQDDYVRRLAQMQGTAA